MNDSVIDNLKSLQLEINNAALRVNRNPSDIVLIPVTKTVEPSRIRMAIEAGYKIIGENRVQEILEKYSNLIDLKPEIHLIGHLQTNKIKDIVNKIDCLQSLDSIRLAEKISLKLNKKLKVLIEINTSNEEQKNGVLEKDVFDLIGAVLQMDNLDLAGFMTVAVNTERSDLIRQCFRKLADIRMRAQDKFSCEFKELSMGMSGDWQIAVEEGATMLRIGSAIFGSRKYH